MIQVSFSDAVFVEGSPSLVLDTGSVNRSATYASGTGSSVLVFSYIVQASDLSPDLDYASVSSLLLNGGSVKNGDSRKAMLMLPPPGTTGSLSANKDLFIGSDSTAPDNVSVSINNGADSTKTTQVSLKLSATDNSGVSAFYASENSTTPSSSAEGWHSLTPRNQYAGKKTFILSAETNPGSYTKTVYVWFKDAKGNVSNRTSDLIQLQVEETDTTVVDNSAPTNPSVVFNADNATTESTVVTLTLSANDDTGVTSYYLSEMTTVPEPNQNGWVSIASSKN